MMKELVDSQREYFLSGHTLPLKGRREALARLHRILLENEKLLADAIYRDFRKSFYLTIENELSLPYGEINRAVRNLGRWSSPVRYRTNLVNFPAKSRSFPVPYGVALVIGPWNYPYMLSLVPAISALAAGNTVIIKPSEITGHASAALAEIINGSFDRSLLHVVEGGADAGSRLIDQGVDKIFFTGSSRVGRVVMKAAARHLTPVTLELGGKNPVIVMEDCHLKRTARRLVWGKFHNNGAACVSPDHVYVHESVRTELIGEIVRQIREIHGEDPRRSIALPRLIDEAHFDRLMRLIERRKVVTGGSGNREMRYLEPTVLDGVEPGDPIMEEEVFGPVLPVLSYRRLDELLETLKRKPAPLAVYVFSGNTGKAKNIIRELRCGGGMINEVVLHFINMNTPFGGFGESGMGSYHGKAGFDAFSHHKTILRKPVWFELFLKYPPYREFRLKILRSVLGKSVRNFFH